VFLPTQQKIIAAGQWLSKRTPLFSHLINSLAELLLVIRCVMCGESALLPADMCGATRDVRFGPIADIAHALFEMKEATN
jgi:hypothetical protein